MTAKRELKTWNTLETRPLLELPPWFTVVCDTIELPSGRVIDDYYRIQSPDYVLVCARDSQGRVLMERHYKPCAGKFVLTCPAGGVEPDEEPLQAAMRELREETGYEASAWDKLGEFIVDGTRGICNAHLFTAVGLKKVSIPVHDEMEDFELSFLNESEIQGGIESGAICLLPDITILSMAKNHSNGVLPVREHK